MKKLNPIHLMGILVMLVIIPVSSFNNIGYNFKSTTYGTLQGLKFTGESDSIYLCEGFNSTTFPPPGWINTGGVYIYRAQVSGFGLGQGSVCFDFWNAATGPLGDLTTLTFYPSYPDDSLEFDIAYCPPGTLTDSINIYFSTNGGINWAYLHDNILTLPPPPPSCTHPFVPTASQWSRKGFVVPSGTNKIKFHAYSGFGDCAYLDSICVVHPVGIKPVSNEVPVVFSLSQNYPNPFNPTTIIKFSLPNPSKGGVMKVTLKIFDVLGREVASLIPPLWGGQEGLNPRIYEVEWDGTNYPSGVYFYKLKVNDFVSTKKLVLLK